MYNTKIIFSGDCIEIYKVNNYVIRERKKSEGAKIIDRMIKTDSKRIKDDASVSIYNSNWDEYFDSIDIPKKVYKYALDMTEKEIKQAVEGMFHNLK